MVTPDRTSTEPHPDAAGDTDAPIPPVQVGAGTVVAVLTVDAMVLAMMELFYLSLSVGSIPLPVSALVALVSTPWLVRKAGEVAGPGAAALPLVVWTLTIAVLGLAGPGGDVLLLADAMTLALVVAGMVPAAFVLGRAIRAGRTQPEGPPRA
jgi:hypothetical protein